jgi:hypothetical protein
MDPFISLIFFLFAHRTSCDEVSDSGFWEPLVPETMLKIKVLSLILSSYEMFVSTILFIYMFLSPNLSVEYVSTTSKCLMAQST